MISAQSSTSEAAGDAGSETSEEQRLDANDPTSIGNAVSHITEIELR